jgi:two-component system cell cycle response regulator
LGSNILVIDDNPANLELMRYLLGAFGHTMTTAESGEEGISAARRERPDLVICDLRLPGMDGYEVARRLRAEYATASVPLVAVTAYAIRGDRERALAAGFDGYIAKPIEPHAFASQIDEFLQAEKRNTVPPQQAPGDAAPAAASAVAANGIYVLVIDDTLANIELLRVILGSAGYEIAAAQNLAQARELALRRPPDLFLSDFHIRRESGLDFIDWV